MSTTSIVVTLSEFARGNLAVRSLEAALRAGTPEDKWADLRASYAEGETAFDLALVAGVSEDAIEHVRLPGDPKPAADGRRPFRVDLSEDERAFIANIAAYEADAKRVHRDDWQAYRPVHPGGALSADVSIILPALMANLAGAALAATSAQDDAAAVKDRIRAITGTPSAALNANLARHLAFETDLPVDMALAILQAAAPPAAPSALAEPVAMTTAH